MPKNTNVRQKNGSFLKGLKILNFRFLQKSQKTRKALIYKRFDDVKSGMSIKTKTRTFDFLNSQKTRKYIIGQTKVKPSTY